MPQGLILGPILFNIFLAELFFVLKDADIASFTNDNTLYTSVKKTGELIESLEKCSNTLFQWFKGKFFKGNCDKCHLMVSTDQKANVNMDKFNIESSDCEKLLGFKIDKR